MYPICSDEYKTYIRSLLTVQFAIYICAPNVANTRRIGQLETREINIIGSAYIQLEYMYRYSRHIPSHIKTQCSCVCMYVQSVAGKGWVHQTMHVERPTMNIVCEPSNLKPTHADGLSGLRTCYCFGCSGSMRRHREHDAVVVVVVVASRCVAREGVRIRNDCNKFQPPPRFTRTGCFRSIPSGSVRSCRQRQRRRRRRCGSCPKANTHSHTRRIPMHWQKQTRRVEHVRGVVDDDFDDDGRQHATSVRRPAERDADVLEFRMAGTKHLGAAGND